LQYIYVTGKRHRKSFITARNVYHERAKCENEERRELKEKKKSVVDWKVGERKTHRRRDPTKKNGAKR